MLIPILVLLYIYYPLLFIYVTPPQIQPAPKKGVFIEIPKIQAQAPIVENVDPWNEAVYQKKLQKGVAQAMGSSPVGSTSGTIYLFAHSSDLPWRMTRQNTAFFKLDQIKSGDEIKLIKNGNEQIFIVTEKKVVWPNEVQYLKNLETDKLKDRSPSGQQPQTSLILQTCTPVGTALQRLLVFAKPKR